MKQGLFWVLAKNENALEKGEFEIISYCEEYISHVDYWKNVVLERKELKLFAYDYFPRGRFWTNDKGIVMLFVNPFLLKPAVIKQLKTLFDLDDTCQVHDDGVPPIKHFLRESL